MPTESEYRAKAGLIKAHLDDIGPMEREVATISSSPGATGGLGGDLIIQALNELAGALSTCGGGLGELHAELVKRADDCHDYDIAIRKWRMRCQEWNQHKADAIELFDLTGVRIPDEPYPAEPPKPFPEAEHQTDDY